MEYDLSNGEEARAMDEMDRGPTFEDLDIDDSLSDLERVAKYVKSNIALQRVIHVKMIEETARSVGYQSTCDRILPLLESIVNDVEYVVRQHVAFQFPPLCRFLVESGGDTGYRLLLDKMVPLISQLVSDPQHEVRSAAADSLVEMAALVQQEDQGQYILTIVLPLAHEDDNEQLRISAVTLYHGLAKHLGQDLCQQFCVPELISLSEDPVFRVRKMTALSFSNVCKTAGLDITRERLLPAFMRLCHDDIWGVRKACAESLVQMSNSLSKDVREDLLVPIFEAFANDSSRWVKLAAYQNLGPFVASLSTTSISDDLLEHFLKMSAIDGNGSASFGGAEVDMKFHCAYSFPAIVSLVGKEQWKTSRLCQVFETLSVDPFWKIRRTFAYSLHELAKILGQEIAETQLATVFDSYLQDVQEVKLGVMIHFADFLACLSPKFRESYLPVLSEFDGFEQITKWRLREVLSGQLSSLCHTFTCSATFSVLYPIVFKLVTDEVALVREQSYHACPLLVERIEENSNWLEEIMTQFNSLAKSIHFIQRQIFLKICQAFLDVAATSSDDSSNSNSSSLRNSSQRIFQQHLAPSFFSLSKDPVSNVRLLFAQILWKYQKHDLLVRNELFPHEIVSRFVDQAGAAVGCEEEFQLALGGVERKKRKTPEEEAAEALSALTLQNSKEQEEEEDMVIASPPPPPV